MKNTLIKIDNTTYFIILISLLSGFIKQTIIIYLIIIIHELGHVFFIKLYKIKIKQIIIYPYGGITLMDNLINSNLKHNIIISMGGILFQLILFIFISIINLDTYTYNIFNYYNKFIILFNLLPMIPLDGSKLINYILNYFYSYHYSYIISGVISLLYLIIISIIIIDIKINNLYIIFFLLYQFYLYIKNYKYMFNKFLLERYLYQLNYYKINNHPKSIKDLKIGVLSYFKVNNKYIKDNKYIYNVK